MTPEAKKELATFWTGKSLWDHPLAEFSTLRVGGPAEVLLVAEAVEQLARLLPWLQKHDIPWRLIGGGSNILVADRGIRGAVIMLGRGFSDLTLGRTSEETTLVRAGAACPLTKLVSFCAAEGLSGAEFATGIPGSVGGAVVMNAGAWGREISEIIHRVTVLKPTGVIEEMNCLQCGFSYRQWGGDKGDVVVAAEFQLKPGNTKEIKITCNKFRRLRLEKQPLNLPSAGSFFKNPPKEAAGRLIEQAGLKGCKIGGAMVSEQHANFIVNTGNATARDVFELFQRVRTEVMNKFNILLEPEIHILGNIGEG